MEAERYGKYLHLPNATLLIATRVYWLGRWTMPHAYQTVHSLMSININYISQLAFGWQGGNE